MTGPDYQPGLMSMCNRTAVAFVLITSTGLVLAYWSTVFMSRAPGAHHRGYGLTSNVTNFTTATRGVPNRRQNNFIRKRPYMDFHGVKVREFVPPEGVTSAASIVYIHGGAWVAGSIESSAALPRALTSATGMMVISVEYRLAPKHLFPAAVDDCEAAIRDFLSVARQHGVDPQRVAVLGTSAGGNLAAAAVMRMRDKKLSLVPKALIMAYPPTQALDFSLPSYLKYRNDRVVALHKMVGFWLLYAIGHKRYQEYVVNGSHVSATTWKQYGHYLQSERTSPPALADSHTEAMWRQMEPIVTNPYFSPALAENLTGLPRTLILTAGKDTLHDDGAIFARRLKESGNDVTFFNYPTLHHSALINRNNDMFKDTVRFLSNNI